MKANFFRLRFPRFNPAALFSGALKSLPAWAIFAFCQLCLPAQAQWSLTGNANTNPATDFIGTTDNQPLNFRVNNVASGKIDLLSNTAFGRYAMFSNTTGDQNTALGGTALYANLSGRYNTALGFETLTLNTDGWYNTATGRRALYFNTTGDYNTGTGVGALYSNVGGNQNTATGRRALHLNTSGSVNTADGVWALHNNTTGLSNTAIGHETMLANIAGSYNTTVGGRSDVAFDNLTNATALGYGAIVNANNKIRLGNASTTAVETQFVTFTTSDRRFKKDIEEDVPGLAFIQALRPVTYFPDVHAYNQFIGIEDNIRRQIPTEEDEPGSDRNLDRELADLHASAELAEQHRVTGFIAQEVFAAARQCDYDFSGVYVPKNERDNYALGYAAFVVPLVKAVQEQQDLLETQQSQIEQLQAQVNSLLRLLPSGNEAPPTAAPAPPATGGAAQTEPLKIAPNPTGGMTNLRFFVEKDAEQVSLFVLDFAGRQVKSLKEGEFAKGSHPLQFDASELTPGTYRVVLRRSGKVFSQALVVQ